ncbi:hypothetical protein [Dipodfec virus UOA04_Rod_715]|nr:hypothetical protein [Dipodfec virus UOA04_Rod_715]
MKNKFRAYSRCYTPGHCRRPYPCKTETDVHKILVHLHHYLSLLVEYRKLGHAKHLYVFTLYNPTRDGIFNLDEAGISFSDFCSKFCHVDSSSEVVAKCGSSNLPFYYDYSKRDTPSAISPDFDPFSLVFTLPDISAVHHVMDCLASLSPYSPSLLGFCYKRY